MSAFNLPVYPNLKTSLEELSKQQYRFVLEPLLPGYGRTFGNSLRRVLLSSVPGSGVTVVRINNLTHEFQPVEGVKEDAVDIVMNLKSMRVKILSQEEDKVSLKLNTQKAGKIFARDFDKNALANLCNPDLYICELDGTQEVNLEVEIERGRGYRSLEELKEVQAQNATDILVDTLFSPVYNVSLNVDQTRVGEKTNFDRIQLDFATDGTVEATDIIGYVFEVLIDMFQRMHSAFVKPDNKSTAAQAQTSESEQHQEEAQASVSGDGLLKDTDLSVSLVRILKKNKIETLDDLKDIAGSGRLEEVHEYTGMSENKIKELEDFVEAHGWKK